MPAPVFPAPTTNRATGRALKPNNKRSAPTAATAATTPGGMPYRRSRLQFLLDIAQATFNQPGAPSPQQIDALRRTLSSVPLEELGLDPHHSSQPASPKDVDSSSSSRSSSPSLTDGAHALLGSLLEEEAAAAAEAAAEAVGARRARPPITYLLIYEDERVSLGIFCLPARARIPLHNHPGMTVMSRVLHGEMHVSSYDWASDADADAGAAAAAAAAATPHLQARQQQLQQQRQAEGLPRQARVVLDRMLTASDQPVVLFPDAGGNIHQFTALTDCAVLDLMSPPYSTDDGRDCTYYSVLPSSQLRACEGGEVMLDAYEPPADFVINQGHYRGVQPRPKLLPLFAGTSLFPSAAGSTGDGSGELSPQASTGGTAAAAAACASLPLSGTVSPVSSPISEATGGPKLNSLLGGDAMGGRGRSTHHKVSDSAASNRSGRAGYRNAY